MKRARCALAAATAALFAGLPQEPAKAAPVEYVKVCSLYGTGSFYIPGTDTCLQVGGFGSLQVGSGSIRNYGSRKFYSEGSSGGSTGGQPLQQVVRCPTAGSGVYTIPGTDTCIRIGGYVRTDSRFVTTRARTDNNYAWGIDAQFDFGFIAYRPSGAFTRGRDTFAVPFNIDRRDIDLDGTSGMVGGSVNAWMLAPSFLGFLPEGTNVFVNTGIQVPIDSTREQTVTGVSSIFANGTVTTRVEDKWGWKVFAGFSVPTPLKVPGILDSVRFRLAGGGVFSEREITVSGTDVGGSFSGSRTDTSFDPGLLWGFRGGSNGLIYGLDIMHTFPCSDKVFVPSQIATQDYLGGSGKGVNTSVSVSVGYQFAGGGTTIFGDSWSPRGRAQRSF